jgi:hypothetical protein
MGFEKLILIDAALFLSMQKANSPEDRVSSILLT